MSHKTFVALVVATGISAVSLVGVAQAYEGMGHGRGGYGYSSQMMNNNVPALTPEQYATIDKLSKEHYSAIAPLQKELAMKEAEYDALMRQANPDPKEAAKIAGEIQDMQNKFFTAGQAYKEKITKETGINAPYGRMGRGMGHDGYRGHGGHDGNYCGWGY